MKTTLGISRVFFSILLIGSIGFFVIDDAFGQKYGGGNNDNEDKKDKEKEERGNPDKEQKERTEKERGEDNKVKEQDEKQQQDDNDNRNDGDVHDKKQNKSEEKRAKLESDKKKIEEKLAEKAKEFEQKLKELKEKSQQKAAEKMPSDGSRQSSFSLSSMTASEPEKSDKKSEKIREKLTAKSEQLDSRTLKILDKINDGRYMGEKISPTKISDNYKLEFDSVTASGIGDKTLTSMLTGNMIFTTFDMGKSDNLKLELEECEISVDDIPYNCGFGKARTISSGQSGEKDSLVIIAFLEDDLIKEVHTSLKIFLNSDIPISQIEEDSGKEVSILGPQSKISHMWFLNGTATLSKFDSVPDGIIAENIKEDSTESASESSDTEHEEQQEEEETPDDEDRESNES